MFHQSAFLLPLKDSREWEKSYSPTGYFCQRKFRVGEKSFPQVFPIKTCQGLSKSRVNAKIPAVEKGLLLSRQKVFPNIYLQG